MKIDNVVRLIKATCVLQNYLRKLVGQRSRWGNACRWRNDDDEIGKKLHDISTKQVKSLCKMIVFPERNFNVSGKFTQNFCDQFFFYRFNILKLHK